MQNTNTCKLCGKHFANNEMSDEHYPAKSTGNNDIVKINLIKIVDMFQSGAMEKRVLEGLSTGKTFKEVSDEIFDRDLAEPLYPAGRTARTLCRDCNTFLGKYDEAYLKFFNADGEAKAIKGFQRNTKIQIIKSIFGKFLSVPEAADEQFDFIPFLRDKELDIYNGKWHLYFVKRDLSTDLLGLAEIETGKDQYDEGVVYELTDDKFIFDLMNFEKHECFEMNDIFDILDKDYHLITGVGNDGGYHAGMVIGRMLEQMADPNNLYEGVDENRDLQRRKDE